jgi:hypothetical protein
MFRMLGSGTEGVMAAIRAARTFTGKKYVIKIGGAYHGWSDQMVYGLHIPGTGRLEATGIPRGASSATREVYPNALGTLRRALTLNRFRRGTAAVIVEPLGPESGTRPVPFDFNQQVRALCDEFGALLIFDEVVTGFRLGLGGAQGYFGIKPDLTVFGKCITGGYPMAGGVGGRREVVMTFAAGIGGTGERAYVGGTLSANPLSCVAGYHALCEIERTTAVGLVTLANLIGTALGMVLTPILIEDGMAIPTVQLIYGGLAAFSAVLFIALARETPPTPPCPPEQEVRALMLDGLKHALKVKPFWFDLAISFIGLGIFNGITTWIENIIRPRGFTPTDAGTLGALMIVGGVIVRGGSHPAHARRHLQRVDSAFWAGLGSFCVYYGSAEDPRWSLYSCTFVSPWLARRECRDCDPNERPPICQITPPSSFPLTSAPLA